MTPKSVTITRTYRATPQELWEMWATKDGFEAWWGPVGFKVVVHALEAQEGGTLHYDMVAATPEMVASMREGGHEPSHPVHARFSEFKPMTRLVITSVIDFLPGVTPYDSTIGVDFEPQGDHVKMVVTLGAHHDEQMTRMAAEGFGSQLTKLDARFA